MTRSSFQIGVVATAEKYRAGLKVEQRRADDTSHDNHRLEPNQAAFVKLPLGH